MFDPNYKFTCVDRFLKYVKYDTQSDEESTSFPSTEKQKKLSADLAKELKKMGLKDAAMDKWGYVMATLPANTNKKYRRLHSLHTLILHPQYPEKM